MNDIASGSYRVDHLALRIELARERCRVRSRLHFRRAGGPAPFRLHGEDLELRRIELDGTPLSPTAYRVDGKGLIVDGLPASGVLSLECQVVPGGAGGTGLIAIGDVLTTHCEPEGFRRITFFPDTPDVMATMRCTLIGDREIFPVMLANGRRRAARDIGGGRHICVFDDPFPKSSYLFALAAGKFARRSEEVLTTTGRKVELVVYAPDADLPYCGHGLATLRAAILWDEAHYGRAYERGVLRSVIIPGYPGGAMENPTLNLYSGEFFLAAPDISTAPELARLTGSVAHEYFHDWTGNRVGIASWRELTLKEGMTVLREQQFMADLLGSAEARLDQVMRLQSQQYPEDDGALAHAPRPEIAEFPSNLYTRTVYEKGAEIMRLLETRLGERRFRRAVARFLDRYAGRAATLEQFLDALDPSGSLGIAGYSAWFRHVGAVARDIAISWDAEAECVRISLAGSPSDAGLPFPVRVGLIGPAGAPQPFHRGDGDAVTEDVFELAADSSSITLFGVAEPPTVSLLRGLSAPVRISSPADPASAARRARFDSDPVNRMLAFRELAEIAVWDGGQKAEDAQAAMLDAYSALLDDPSKQSGVVARLLRLPDAADLMRNHMTQLDTGLARLTALRTHVAMALSDRLLRTLRSLPRQPDASLGLEMPRLAAACLRMLSYHPSAGVEDAQLRLPDMTMEIAAASLHRLVDAGGATRSAALADAGEAWSPVPMRFDNLYMVLGSSEAGDAGIFAARFLEARPLEPANPARLKAFFDRFGANPIAFHNRDGSGYRLMVDAITALRTANPGIAARLVKSFSDWRSLDAPRREQAADLLHGLARREDVAPQLRHRLAALLN